MARRKQIGECVNEALPNKNDVIRKRSGLKAVNPTLPDTTSDLRRVVIEASGVTVEKLADQFKQAIQALDDALVAEKVQYFSHQGEVVDSRTDIDHSTRLKAIDVWANLTGVGANKASLSGSNAGNTQVNITLNAPFIDSIRNASKTYTVEAKEVKYDER